MVRLGRWLPWTLGLLLVGGSLLTLLGVEIWRVPDDEWLAASIAPTLRAGDTVVLLEDDTPQVGDLVRCDDPEVEGRMVVGRLVGMPGDHVEVHSAGITINGVRYTTSDACVERTFEVDYPSRGPVEVSCARTDLGGGWYFIGRMREPMSRSPKRAVVGQGRVFIVSDNRDIHDDSRDFGTLPLESCSRRIVFRLWSAKGWADTKRRLSLVR